MWNYVAIIRDQQGLKLALQEITLIETQIKDTKDFKSLKTTLFNESILKGFNPSKIRLVSENKIIK